MTLTILASGSKANAALIQTERTRVLLDCGLAYGELFRALCDIGVVPESIDACVISHVHLDHARAAKALHDKLRMRICCSTEMDILCFKGGLRPFAVFEPGKSIEIGDILVTPFPVPHDCYCDGFVFEADNRRIGFATDFGPAVTEEVERHLIGCHLVALESNFCEYMLLANQYPAALKKRVLANHLSNEACCGFLEKLDERTSQVVLLHLSESSNSPALAALMAKKALRRSGSTALLQLGLEVTGEAL